MPRERMRLLLLDKEPPLALLSQLMALSSAYFAEAEDTATMMWKVLKYPTGTPAWFNTDDMLDKVGAAVDAVIEARSKPVALNDFERDYLIALLEDDKYNGMPEAKAKLLAKLQFANMPKQGDADGG